MSQEPPPLPDRTGSRAASPAIAGMAEIVAAGAPLQAGLRVLAEEAPQARLRRLLESLADSVARGESLERTVSKLEGRSAPPYLASLVAAGIRTGTLAPLLERVVAHQRATAELRRQARGALAYPLVLYGILILVVLMLLVGVMPGIIGMFSDFGVELAPPTQIVVMMTQQVWLVMAALVAPPLAVGLMAWLPGPAIVHRLRMFVPLLGPMWRMTSQAEFCRTLALFVRHGEPYSKGLLPAAFAAGDADIVAGARALEESVSLGEPLSSAIESLDHFPPTLQPALAWGERSGEMAQALEGAADLYEGHARNYGRLLQSIVPSLAFLFIAMATVFLAHAILMPLLKIIEQLSG